MRVLWVLSLLGLSACNLDADQRQRCLAGDTELCLSVARRTMAGNGIEVVAGVEARFDLAKVRADDRSLWFLKHACLQGNLPACRFIWLSSGPVPTGGLPAEELDKARLHAL